MSAIAVASVVTTRASGRPPRRPGPPAIQPAVGQTWKSHWLLARFALRAMAYTVAAMIGLGGVPAAVALLDDAGIFAGMMFAL